ncbi:MAG: class I SAM-dependent methyltransferase [Myxococcota bacterium]
MAHALHERNRLSWNAATRAHNSHKRDQAGFLRSGGSTLFPEELELLGPLEGRRLLHLLCNSGQDTLSLAQRGALVTGVDISDEAIAFASQLSASSGIAGSFLRSDVYDYLAAATSDRFELCFSSYGFLGWLSDLGRFARGVFERLIPGGRWAFIEFHPLLVSMGPNWKLFEPYFTEGFMFEDPIGDYVAASGSALAPSGFEEGVVDFKNPHPTACFGWTVAETLTAVLEAGFVLRRYVEYPYSNGCRFQPSMRALPGNRFGAPEGEQAIPMMFGVVAERPNA